MTEDTRPVEYDFPISDFYKGHILNAHTVTHSGPWWTAVLLIEDPKSKKPFIGLYRWQKTQNGWKTRKRFTFKRTEEVKDIMKLLEEYSEKLP